MISLYVVLEITYNFKLIINLQEQLTCQWTLAS